MTLFDLEMFLKRGDYSLRLKLNEKKYRASIMDNMGGYWEGTSSTLAAAIDNALLELRTRPAKKDESQWPTAAQVLARSVGNSTVTAFVSSAHPSTGIDPNAAKKARAMSTMMAYQKQSSNALTVGDVFTNGFGSYWEFDGSVWVPIP